MNAGRAGAHGSDDGSPMCGDLRASDADRERVVVRLRDASAEGRLTLEELADRTVQAHRARTRAELERVTSDLPAPAAPAVPETGARARIAAVLGSVRRGGGLRLAPSTRVVSVLGSVELDLRRAVLPAGVVELRVSCWLGNVSVVVPQGVEIEDGLTAVLSNSERDGNPGALSPDAPRLRLTGLVALGNVAVVYGRRR